MTKKLFVTLSLLVVTMMVMAVPAKRGVWKTLLLEDGTELRAQLVGDEHGHFWRATDGTAYVKVKGTDYYVTVDEQQVVTKAKARRAMVNAKRVQKREFGHPTTILGKKKAVIILANFKDTKFKTANNNALYQRIANEENFSYGKFKGSMADYFKAQSRGKFELEFDVVGPVTVSQNVSYYGNNDKDDNDQHPGEMIIEAVNLAKKEISDWTPYDWDGDGYVDQVYVVYAGKGEADGGAESTIWPHAYDLKSSQYYGDGSGPVEVGSNLYVNSYACGGELNGQTGEIAGIGTMCHEYSHCLGYPDFYDTDYSGGQGMCVWDLMDSGSYNGDGYQPAGYTSYERWFAGWETPVTLEDEDVTVENMKSLQNGGESYIIYNKRNRNEYFLLENRQLEGWDASLYGAGLLILHVDYNAGLWESNQPNDDPSHQRMTWIPADKKYQYESWNGSKYYDVDGIENDPFPYRTNNSFNKNFGTMAKLYNKNSNSTYYLDCSVEQIKQNADGTISFNFVANSGGSTEDPGGDEPYVKPTVDGALFYESFDQCTSKGGNDGYWDNQIANGDLLTDNSSWTVSNGFGANQCAKFGTSSKAGKATTPSFPINGTAVLTFRAGAWKSQKESTTLKLSATGATISETSVTLNKGEFRDYSVTLTGTGNVRVTFESAVTKNGRFFLDEVTITDPNATTAVRTIATPRTTSGRIYTLDGRYVGTDPNQLPHGLYIIDGKKVIR
ncbi:MAG: M6 family metalloprotease domain-containing protein [Prevotella sp.]|nr:M6 family metalloprotease domain-containing protein [Prevotella sp.]